MGNEEKRPPKNCRSCEHRDIDIYRFPCVECHSTNYKFYVYKEIKQVEKKTSEFQVKEFVFD